MMEGTETNTAPAEIRLPVEVSVQETVRFIQTHFDYLFVRLAGREGKN
jgi:hypothetical protein